MSSDNHPEPVERIDEISPQSTHAELKQYLATLIGTDPGRYSTDLGDERHKKLRTEEIDAICDALGIGFVDGRKQQKMDTVMLKLGRDHRTGVGMWDTSDLVALIERLEAEVT